MCGISTLSLLFYPLCPSLVSDSRAATPLKRPLRDRLVAVGSSLSVCQGPSLPMARTSLSVDALAPLPVLDSGGSLAEVTTRFQGIPFLSGLATLGSSFQVPQFHSSTLLT